MAARGRWCAAHVHNECASAVVCKQSDGNVVWRVRYGVVVGTLGGWGRVVCRRTRVDNKRRMRCN